MNDQGLEPRRELPTDADALGPMGPAFDDALSAGIEALGLTDQPAADAAARASYEAHARLLRDWNAAINLTAIRGAAEIATRHTCDALSAVPHLAGLIRDGSSVLDMGSGGGYPGLPLAAALPLGRVSLVDSVQKKARFLGVAGAAVTAKLSGVERSADLVIEAVPERLEDMAEEPDQRSMYDVVTARAVGSLAEVLELGLPMAREGGDVVAWKREDERDGLETELRRAGSIIRAAGGGRPDVIRIEAEVLDGHRLVIVPKERPTPATYPRPAGVRKRRKR